jgi:hypothetical protein
MPALRDPRHETFAQCLVRGEPLMQAWAAAGFDSAQRYATRLSRNTRVAARIADLTAIAREAARKTAWSGSDDVAPVIDKLVEYADMAAQLNTAASHVAARAYLVEIARLKNQIDTAPRLVERELTEEEWVAKYGQPAPMPST